ncbi:hypothetical protein ILUMI_08316 [Ignelater luminosus]|uniref:Annexin n=1 Tax=Ignelater luminosus TaxID=2038154 RepID=A0A8K0DBJ8_IGNLU|nr:hypothetical protein ILUMI_08316 [Ignelater luminosus]
MGESPAEIMPKTHGATIQPNPIEAETLDVELSIRRSTTESVVSTTPVLESINKEATDFYEPKVDAEAIHDALEASPVDTKTIVQVLAGRTGAQRLKIVEEYKILYKSKLAEDLNQKLEGWFKELMVAVVTPLIDYYVKELYEAMYGRGTDEDTLIDIICTSSSQQIREIVAVFKDTYKEPLESYIQIDTSGYFKELLLALISANRDQSETVNSEQAAADAKTLYQAGEGMFGTDESTFITILTQRNYKQLKQIFDEYQKLTGHSLEDAIQIEFSGFVKRGLLAIIKTVLNLPSYFADRLHASMSGTGTYNKHLIRIVATRSDIDLFLVRIYYNLNYEVTLEEDIIDDTSGDYRTGLLRLVEGN